MAKAGTTGTGATPPSPEELAALWGEKDLEETTRSQDFALPKSGPSLRQPCATHSMRHKPVSLARVLRSKLRLSTRVRKLS